MGLKNEIAKSNLIFTSSNITCAIIGFFFSIILARLLQPYHFGLYSFALVIISFFIIFTDWGTGPIIVRFTSNYFAKKEYGKISSLVRMTFKYRIVITLVIGSVLSIFSGQIATFVFNKPDAGFVVFLAGILLILESLTEFFVGLFTGFKNFKYVAAVRTSAKIFRFVFAISLVLIGLKSFGAILGLGISDVLVIFICLFFLKRYAGVISARREEIDKRILISFGFWSFIGSVSVTIYSLIDSFMISILMGIEDIGFYGIAHTWMFALATLLPISATVLYPYFSGSEKPKELNLMFYNSLRYMLILIFPLAFLLSAFSKQVVLFLYKDVFLPAVPALEILSFSAIPLIISALLVAYFSGIKRPDISTKIVSIALVMNIILNYTLIQLYGIVGAATATLISRLFEVCLLLFVALVIKKLMFRASIIWKPLLASVIVYFLVPLFFVANIYFLIFYGLVSLGIYFGIMFLIGGVTKEDIQVFKDLISPLIKRP